MEMDCIFLPIILKPWPKMYCDTMEHFSCKKSVDIFFLHFKECFGMSKGHSEALIFFVKFGPEDSAPSIWPLKLKTGLYNPRCCLPIP